MSDADGEIPMVLYIGLIIRLLAINMAPKYVKKFVYITNSDYMTKL
jgi:hypothetical protein